MDPEADLHLYTGGRRKRSRANGAMTFLCLSLHKALPLLYTCVIRTLWFLCCLSRDEQFAGRGHQEDASAPSGYVFYMNCFANLSEKLLNQSCSFQFLASASTEGHPCLTQGHLEFWAQAGGWWCTGGRRHVGCHPELLINRLIKPGGTYAYDKQQGL